MKKLFLFILLTGLISNAFSQVTTTVNPSIAQLTQKLSGNGITISNVVLTCPSGAYALYSGGTGALSSLTSGILLTTGSAANVQPSSTNQDFDNGAPGSTLGDNLDLSGNGTYDGCTLKFLITPSCNTLSIKYIFASEEYPENVNLNVSDVFGFVIDGPNPSGGSYNQTNIALVPGTTLPVSIDNVNNGFLPPFGPCTNCAYYIDSPVGMVYDGCTTVLSASTQVIPCSQYTMTIGVWDVGDNLYDSGVFLDVNGISCINSPTITAVASPANICGAQTITLTAGGGIAGGTYTWTAPASGGLVSTTSPTVTANPTSATTYTVLYSDANTCPGSPLTKTTTVTFTPPPALPVSQSPNGAICAGQSVTLTATGGTGTYSWTPGTTLSNTTNSVTISTPSITTTYTVTKSQGACVSNTVITVTVNSTSTSITPSTSTICAGQTATLISSGGGPFSWTASSGANPPSTGTITVSPLTTTTYSVLVGSGTCTASAVAIVSISATPSISITPSLSTICVGQSVALSSSGGGPFTWTSSIGATPTSAANVTVSPTTTTTYTVLSGTGTCTASAVATVSISSTPSISITPSLSTICVGQSVALSSSGTGPFAWMSSSGTPPPSIANVTVSPISTTTYTVLSGTGTCTATAVAIVSISAVPSISVTPSNTSICVGQSVTLTSSGSAPFVWTASNGTSPAATASITVSPTVSTTYTVLSGAGTCTSSATASINIIVVTPSITTSSSYYCTGVPPVSLTGIGATTYSWAPATDLSSSSGAIITATPSTSMIYTLTATTSGCISTQTVSINVPPISTLTAVTSAPIICIRTTGATLTASGANTYTWSPGSVNTVTSNVNPTTTTNYTVIGQTTAGCFAIPAVVTVSVVPNINPTLSSSSPSVCISQTVYIAAPTSTAALTYTWQPTTAIQGAANTSSIVALPTTSSTTIYTVTISNGICSASDTIQIKVLTPPTNNHFITLNNDTICVGGCVTFSASTIGSQPMTYKWYYESGVGTSSVGIHPEACYPTTGSFSVMSIASNSCGTDTVIQNNFVTVYDFPVLVVSNDTTIKIGESGEIWAAGGLSYQWYPDSYSTIACSTCSNTVVQPTITTQYIVVASNSPYCSVQDTVIVNVDVNCGDFFIPNVFSPNGDGLNDVINVHGRCIRTFNLQIFNRWGEKVFETSTLSESWDGTFRGQKMDTGVFVYKADGESIDGQTFKLKGNITLIR